MENKICCIFNLGPHYRMPIYNLMDTELGCDFYFGDKVETKIKELDYYSLFGFKKIVKNVFILNSYFIWQKNVVQLIFKRQYKYFILTGDSSIISNWVIAFLAILLNKKTFIWTHGLIGEMSWKGKFLNYPLYLMANKILLYSNYSKSIMIEKGFPSSKMVCVYNSLDYELQLSIRKKLVKTSIFRDYFKNEYPVIIFIGRIQKVKKIDMIIQAMSILKLNGVFCNLVIIGSEVEKTDINSIISNAMLQDNTWIYGECYNEFEIGELIYNADVCVSPGNIGLTAIHCFSYGTPAITNDNFILQMPEFEIIKSKVTGDFFIEDDVVDLSLKILDWINLEDSRRESIRNATYSIIDNYYNPRYQVEVLKSLIN